MSPKVSYNSAHRVLDPSAHRAARYLLCISCALVFPSLTLNVQESQAGQKAASAHRRAVADVAERAARNPTLAHYLATSRARLNPRSRVVGDGVDIEIHSRSTPPQTGAYDPSSQTLTLPASINVSDVSAVYARDQRTGIIARLTYPDDAHHLDMASFRTALISQLDRCQFAELAAAAHERAQNAVGQMPLDATHPPQHLLVRFSSIATLRGRYDTLASHGCTIVRELLAQDVYLILAPEHAALQAVANNLLACPVVQHVHPNWAFQLDGITPDDEYWSTQSNGLQLIGAEQAWAWFDENYDGTISSNEVPCDDIVIAILDSGVNYNHEDLSNVMWVNANEVPGNGVDDDDNGFVDDYRGWDFAAFPNDNDPMDEYYHGTFVAGIAAAETNNGTGIAGTAWGARIMPVRITLSPQGVIDSAIDAIHYAADNGADVINMSFGYQLSDDWWMWGSSAELEQAVEYAYAHDVVLVGSSGNDGIDTSDDPHFPSDFFHVISVGNVSGDERYETSNYGVNLDLCAPGVQVASTDIGGWYSDSYVGTSLSAPFVSGVAAIVRGAYPTMSAAEVRLRLASPQACDPLADNQPVPDEHVKSDEVGWGRINAIKAIDQSAPAVTNKDYTSAIDTDIYVYFNDRLDMETVSNDTVFVDGGISGSHQRGFFFVVEPETGKGRLRIDPDPDFAYGETVYVSLTSGVMDYAGYALAPTAFAFQIEHEVPPDGLPPTIYVTAPLQPGEEADDTYLIQWIDQDPDSNASVWLYYDDDSNPANGYWPAAPYETQAPLPLEEDDPQDSFIWDTENVPAGTYYVHGRISDGDNEHWDTAPGTVLVEHPTLGNRVQLEAVELSDDTPDADGDGIVESGEAIDCVITLANVSDATAYAVSADLSTITSGVTITDGHTWYGDIAAEAESTGNGDYDFDTDPGFSGLIAFVLEIEYEDGDGSEHFAYRAFHANVCEPGACDVVLSVSEIIVVDDCSDCDGDGVFESGEQVDVYVELWNSGNATCVNPRGTLIQISTWGSDVFSDLQVDYPDIPPNSWRTSDDALNTYTAPRTFTGSLDTTMDACFGPDHAECQQLPVSLSVEPVPWITLSPTGYDFGIVSPGTIVAQQFIIGNIGSGDLHIDSIDSDNQDTSVVGAPTIVVPAGSEAFSVQIDTAGEYGFITRTVSVTSDAHRAETKTIVITGTVADPPVSGYELIWEIPHPPGPLTWNNVLGADTDNDGNPEILATVDGDSASYPGHLYIYEKVSDDDFQLKWTSPALGGVMDWHGLASGDFDGNGYADIVVLTSSSYVSGSWYPYVVRWFEADGDDSWTDRGTPISDSENEMLGVDAGDADDDGNGDIVVAVAGVYVDHPKVRVFEHTGASFVHRWDSPDILDDYGGPVDAILGVKIADSDSDGHSEIIFATDDAKLYVFESTGNNSYNSTPHLPAGLAEYIRDGSGTEPIAIDVADTDGDSLREIILAAPNYAILVEATGNNSWSNVWQYALPDCGTSVMAGNTDDDDNLEIVVGLDQDNVIVFDVVANNSPVPSWEGDGESDVMSLTLANTNASLWNELVVATDDVHIKVITYVALEADVQVVPANISSIPENPTEGELTALTATVQNVGGGEASDVVVRFYEGAPDAGGIQIGDDQLLGTIPGGQVAVASENWMPALAGDTDICVRAECAGESETGNNQGCITVTAHDDDVDGPEITDITVEEYQGDGDGVIEDDEQVRISWLANDPAGISETSCTVDGTTYPAQGQYEVVVGPFTASGYDALISATDADNSPETSESNASFTVHWHAPMVVSTTPPDGAIDVVRMPEIAATFNTGLDPATVSISTMLVEGAASGSVGGDVSYDGAQHRAVFFPTSPLSYSETYTVTLVSGPTGIRDENDNEMELDYSWSFATVDDATLPLAIIDSPETGATVEGEVQIVGTAWDEIFDHYELYVGEGTEPATWELIMGPVTVPVVNDLLGTWDSSEYAEGIYTLKLVVSDAPPASNVAEDSATVVLPCQCDFDCDGDVDLDEYTLVAGCMAGPGEGLAPGCWLADLDGDNDVDLEDFAQLQRAFTGELPPELILFVDDDAASGGDGASWGTAFDDLQAALAAAVAGTEIHVAGGLYRPAGPGGPRSDTFELADGVTIYGGYAGLANLANPDERDVETYRSTLTGDLNNDDDGFANTEDNSFHVVSATQTGVTAVLNGVTIEGGNADGDDSIRANRGAGVYVWEGSATLSQCTVRRNQTAADGGGIYAGHGNEVVLADCTISGNAAAGDGGGVYLVWSEPLITECTVTDNDASSDGGGIACWDSDPQIRNCYLSNNYAAQRGGGLHCAGSSIPEIVNCVVAANSSSDTGGGIYCSNSTASIINCTLTQNSAANSGGGVFCAYHVDAVITNCILWDNLGTPGPEVAVYSEASPSTLTVSYSDIEGGTGGLYIDVGCTLNWGAGNRDADPQFVDAGSGDLRLLAGSPCIDAGDNTAVPLGVTTDLDGNQRFVDDPSTEDSGVGTPPIIDLGAYEHQGCRDMVLIPAGEFQMGDSFGEGNPDELPIHTVYLSPYYLDKYEVTNQEYAAGLNWAWLQGGLMTVTDGVVYQYGSGTSYPLCNTNSADANSRIHWDGSVFTVAEGKADHPMLEVSWHGAVALCNWRSAMEGKPLCYDLSTWTCDFGAGGYRLPTEAEWEKAAGWDPVLESRFRFGEHTDGCGFNCLEGQRANYFGSGDPYEVDPDPYTTPVGFYNGELHDKADFGWPGSQTDYETQNAQSYYGCYDMAGNVWEWCNDWYLDIYYSSSPEADPTGPASGTYRVLRGGQWSNYPRYCRSAQRNFATPAERTSSRGFRCAVVATCEDDPDCDDGDPCNGAEWCDTQTERCQSGSVSADCNGNGRLDTCDIDDGTSQDCQPDGVPDECQLEGNDCNGNDIPDECDIASGFSEDENSNGIPDECEGWVLESVDSIGDVGASCSVAVSAGGRIGISYLDATNWQLKYAEWDGSQWRIETVPDSDTWDEKIKGTSLGFVGEAPVISFNGDPRALRFASRETGSWVVTTVQSSGDKCGEYSSLRVVGNRIGIAYKESTDGEGRYTERVDGTWEPAESVTGSVRSHYFSMDFVGTDPFVGYFVTSPISSEVARWTGSAWSTATFPVLQPTVAAGSGTCGLIGDNSSAGIVFYEWASGAWGVQEVVAPSGANGSYIGLAHNGASYWAAYKDESNQLWLAEGTPEGWVAELVEDSVWSKRWIALAFRDGAPIIVYYDEAENDLRAARFVPAP